MKISTFTKNIWMYLGLYVGFGACQERDDVIFAAEDDSAISHTNYTQEHQRVRIPESLLIQLKDVRNTTDFMTRFVADSNDNETPENATSGVSGRRGLAAAAAAMIAPFAECQPEQQVVELAKSEFSDVLIWPPCVRVRRCGGCCTSKMLKCRPVAVSVHNVTVLRVRYNPQNSDTFEGEGQSVISLQQHDRCACGCRVQPEDCTLENQEYQENECRCVCTNHDQFLNCTGPSRLWDSNECLCKCRRTRQCSTGLYFNVFSCRCESIRNSLIGTRARSSDGSRVAFSDASNANSSLSIASGK